MSSYQMLGRQLGGEQLPMPAAQLAGVLDLAGDEDPRTLSDPPHRRQY